MAELRRVCVWPVRDSAVVVCVVLLSSLAAPLAAQAAAVAPAACSLSPAVAQRVSQGDVAVTATPSNGVVSGAASGAAGAGGPLSPTVFAAETSRVQRDTLGRRRGGGAVHTNAAGDVVAMPASGAAASGGSRSGSAVRAWTVQVASYETLDEATTMQQTLCQRGYETRIVGTGRPYTVRVGRFGTSQAALAVARRLANRKLTVFITPAEP